MAYRFRIGFQLSMRNVLMPDANEPNRVVLASGPGGQTVSISSGNDMPINKSRDLVLSGGPYPSEEAAHMAGREWRGYLQLSFARLGVGADFGKSGPSAFFFNSALRMIENQIGNSALNDSLGLLVYKADPSPGFVSPPIITPSAGIPARWLIEAADAAKLRNAALTAQEELAYHLYSGSFFQPAADARFMMLMMSLETLIEQRPRSAAVAKHIDRLMAITRDSGLPTAEIQSIRGSLEWLYIESVGQAGKRLAATLADRLYMGDPAPKFFRRCYDLRSALVHGNAARPPRTEIDQYATEMQKFVSHLLGATLIDLPYY